MRPVTVRRAVPMDLAAFRRLSSMLFESDSRFDPHFNKKWAFEDHGEKYFQSVLEDGVCLLAECDGEAIGLLDASLQNGNATATILRSEIGQIYVVPRMRRKGVARQMVKEYVQWCERRHVVEITVGVFAANLEATAFYATFGLSPWITKLNGNLKDVAVKFRLPKEESSDRAPE